jgi:AcrR family transcriptional regulator
MNLVIASPRAQNTTESCRAFARDGCLITADATAIRGRERIRPVTAQMVLRHRDGYLFDMNAGNAKAKRRYRMGARAKATEATRLKILEAVEAAFQELFYDEMTLAAIAGRAGVSVQTVLRHFDSKEALFTASYLHTAEKMGGDRGPLPVGSPKAIVANLVDHYERFGDRILWMLAQEEREPTLKNLADLGRLYHLHWCKQAFAPSLEGLRGRTRERRLAQFVTGTDIYTWKLLRRDRKLSREQTKLAMRELLEPLMKV